MALERFWKNAMGSMANFQVKTRKGILSWAVGAKGMFSRARTEPRPRGGCQGPGQGLGPAAPLGRGPAQAQETEILQYIDIYIYIYLSIWAQVDPGPTFGPRAHIWDPGPHLGSNRSCKTCISPTCSLDPSWVQKRGRSFFTAIAIL